MEKYDYYKAVKGDIKDYLDENYGGRRITGRMREEIYDDLWVDDGVTGNASGSYTFSTYKAEENLCHNLDLLHEAMEEFGDTGSVLEKGAEACDVTIRCYLLGQLLDECVKEHNRNN